MRVTADNLIQSGQEHCTPCSRCVAQCCWTNLLVAFAPDADDPDCVGYDGPVSSIQL